MIFGGLTPSDTTNFATSGPARPCASTSSPLSSSSALSACWKSMWALTSFGAHSVMGTQPSSSTPP